VPFSPKTTQTIKNKIYLPLAGTISKRTRKEVKGKRKKEKVAQGTVLRAQRVCDFSSVAAIFW
jgi:hypothetical protein